MNIKTFGLLAYGAIVGIILGMLYFHWAVIPVVYVNSDGNCVQVVMMDGRDGNCGLLPERYESVIVSDQYKGMWK